MCMPASPSTKLSKADQDYRAEDDFRTLQRAEDVRLDTTRHARAQAHGRKQILAMSRVLGRGMAGKAGRIAKRAPTRRA